MLLFMDGMGHYDTAGIAAKYTARSDDHVTWSVVSEGRYGNCLKRVSTNNAIQSGYLAIAPFATQGGLWTAVSAGVCGFAIKVDDLSRIGAGESSGSAYGLLVLIESGMPSPLGSQPYHVRVGLNSNGTFTLYKRMVDIGGDQVLANSIEGLQSNAWAYVEFRWLISHTGSFEIRVNTIPVLTFTGDTRVSDATNFGVWNSIKLLTVASASGAPFLTLRIADLYLADGAGGAGAVTDFLGDGIIQTLFPNGPGLAAGWTPSGGANWDMVNDTPVPDGDATYVETTAPSTRDCHPFEDIPVGSTILGVHYNILARKGSEGSLTVKPIVGQDGVMYDGPTQGVASTAYDRYLTQPYDVNPATGAAWTAAEINAGQWGILKLT